MKSIFSLASLSLSLEHLPLAGGQRQGGVVVDQQSPSKFISTGELRQHRRKTSTQFRLTLANDELTLFISIFEQYECCGSIVEIGIDRNLSMFFLCLVHNTFFGQHTLFAIHYFLTEGSLCARKVQFFLTLFKRGIPMFKNYVVNFV